LTLDVKKSNSSNETPNVMTVGVEKYGLTESDPLRESVHGMPLPKSNFEVALKEKDHANGSYGKLEDFAGCLAPASEVAGGHTLPF
jgi:hypothetical protein